MQGGLERKKRWPWKATGTERGGAGISGCMGVGGTQAQTIWLKLIGEGKKKGTRDGEHRAEQTILIDPPNQKTPYCHGERGIGKSRDLCVTRILNTD